EPLDGKPLNPPGGGRTRELREQLCVLGAQVRALAAEPIERHVQPEDRDVHRDNAGEQNGDDGDPEHASGDASLRTRAWSASRTRSRGAFGPGGGGPGGHLVGLDSHAETRGSRAWVEGELLRGRPDRLPRHRAHLRLLAADADRKVRRTLATPLEI